MDRQGETAGERRTEDDWWHDLYAEGVPDTGPQRAGDTLDDRFASVARAVEEESEPAGPAPPGAAGPSRASAAEPYDQMRDPDYPVPAPEPLPEPSPEPLPAAETPPAAAPQPSDSAPEAPSVAGVPGFTERAEPAAAAGRGWTDDVFAGLREDLRADRSLERAEADEADAGDGPGVADEVEVAESRPEPEREPEPVPYDPPPPPPAPRESAQPGPWDSAEPAWWESVARAPADAAPPGREEVVDAAPVEGPPRGVREFADPDPAQAAVPAPWESTDAASAEPPPPEPRDVAEDAPTGAVPTGGETTGPDAPDAVPSGPRDPARPAPGHPAGSVPAERAEPGPGETLPPAPAPADPADEAESRAGANAPPEPAPRTTAQPTRPTPEASIPPAPGASAPPGSGDAAEPPAGATAPAVSAPRPEAGPVPPARAGADQSPPAPAESAPPASAPPAPAESADSADGGPPPATLRLRHVAATDTLTDADWAGRRAGSFVGGGPPTYEAEPTALPEVAPGALGELMPDTVLDGARYGSFTLRTAATRGDSPRYRGELRRDALLTARFGGGDDALVFVAVATGARGVPRTDRAAVSLVRWMGEAVGRSRARLSEDIRTGRRAALKGGLHRLTGRTYGLMRAQAEEFGVDPAGYTAGLRCLLLSADPACRTRVFFGTGPGGLFRLRGAEWQDLEPAPPADGEDGKGDEDGRGEEDPGDRPGAPVDPRLTVDLGARPPRSDPAGPPPPGFGAPGSAPPPDAPPGFGALVPTPDPGEPAPFAFRASEGRPGDVLLLCSPGMAEPLRGAPGLAAELAERWRGEGAPPGLAAFLGDVQLRAKGFADDRTAAALWES